MTEGTDFKSDLAALINKNSCENTSNTPGYILAGYLYECLVAFDIAQIKRDRWYKKADYE